jgi:hypothetical protein
MWISVIMICISLLYLIGWCSYILIHQQQQQQHRRDEEEAAVAAADAAKDAEDIVFRSEKMLKMYGSKPRCVFTVTTIPSRISRMVKTVDNLLKQSINVERVIINLPRWSKRENCAYIVPCELTLLQKNYDGRVFINRVRDDLGPATKLIPTLSIEKHPNTRIFPVDDDCTFPIHYFDELLYASIMEPNTAFGYHGMMVTHNEETNTNICNLMHLHKGPVDIVETVTGAVYRRAMFNEHTILPICKQCFLTDDIWISYHVKNNGYARKLLMSGVDNTVTRGRAGMPMTNDLNAPNPLYIDNVFGNNNDKCVSNVWQYHSKHITSER